MGSFITSSILSYVFILSSYPTSIFVSFQGLIRAPTQGATISGKRAASGHHSFNPRSHAGSDSRLRFLPACYKGFNPRSHAGSDEERCQSSDLPRVSIHAPTQGATFHLHELQLILLVSIHAPTQGATSWRGWRSLYSVVSIHAPTQGATVMLTPSNYKNVFQSTLPRRERRS